MESKRTKKKKKKQRRKTQEIKGSVSKGSAKNLLFNKKQMQNNENKFFAKRGNLFFSFFLDNSTKREKIFFLVEFQEGS